MMNVLDPFDIEGNDIKNKKINHKLETLLTNVALTLIKPSRPRP